MPAPTQVAHSKIGTVDVSSIILHTDRGDMAETVVFLNGTPVEGLTEYQTVRGGNVRDNHRDVCEKVRTALYG